MKIKLSRILKIISTILIAVGIAYLFLFVLEQNRSVTDILDDRPQGTGPYERRLHFCGEY